MTDTLTGKDAFFAITEEQSFDENMDDIQKENTMLVVKHINSTPKLYNDFKYEVSRHKDPDDMIDAAAEFCVDYAEMHNNEFGDLFQTELDMVDWHEVVRRV